MEKASLIMRSERVKWDSSCSSSSTNMSFESREKTSGGYTWPQRNYPCAFCKKQFKSAQALGGHMNVHRRERALLRSSVLLSPPKPTTLDPPNPTAKPSFLVPHAASHHSSSLISTPYLGSVSSPSKSSSTWIDEEKTVLDQRKKLGRDGAFLGFGKWKSFTAQEVDDHEYGVLKKKENFVRLELGMGLASDGKEDLDLELRLGFS